MTKETYDKSVDILLDAYNSEKLIAGSCSHCAVGNLLNTASWTNDFVFRDNGQVDYRVTRRYKVKGGYITMPKHKQKRYDKLYKEKGFKREELMQIERAFEGAMHGHDYRYILSNQAQFEGLTAVLNVMKDMVEENVPHKDNMKRLKEVYYKFEKYELHRSKG